MTVNQDYRIACAACGTLDDSGQCICTQAHMLAQGHRWRPVLLTRKERRKVWSFLRYANGADKAAESA